MEEKLLGRAVEYHGPDFLRQLQLEQQNLPPNIFLHLQRHRPHPPEIDDPQFIMNVRRFISKKADMLFKPMENKDVKPSINTLDDNEDSYAKMPPLETFMGIDPNTCRRHFFNSVKAKDLVIGIVTSILDSGLVLQLLCMDDDKNRDIDSLRITAFVPVKEIPKMFPTQNPTEGYQVQDFIRGVVVNVNVESENILVSLSDRELQEREGTMPHLGLIHEEDFPVQYRRKLHIRGLTFDELLNSIMGFTNPGNVKYLLRNLNQGEDVSMMRGLHRLKIPEKEYAESLKKQQSQKMAYKNVAQGIAFFKEGRQTEAMQQLNKALQIDPRNVEALVARGALYANNESYNRAIEDFEEALQVNKKHPNAIKYMHETLLAKGKGHEDSGDWDDAEECYKKALDLQPDSVEAQESIRYVKYRKESGKGKTRQDKKSYDEKSKTPPYQSTTVTLKKLIDEDTKSRKKKSDDIKQESRRKSRKYSSSSSSSGSSSSSRSRSRSRSEVKSRSSRQRSRSPRKGLSKARSRSPSLRERDINQRSRSPRKRSTSPRKRSRSPRKRSPSPRKRSRSPVTSKSREYKTEDPVRRQSEEYSRRVSEQDGSSHHFNFFKKDERIPFLDSSPQKEETVEHVVKDVLENKPIDDEDDDLYGDSIYEKPDRNFPVVDVKHPSQADIQHYEHGFDNQKNEAYSGSPGLRGSHLQVKEAKEVSVTPTRDEINDRLGLEDISPDIHDDRRNDDVKYRSSLDGKGPKRSLHISKAWSPNERYESKGRRYSPDYERDSPRRRDERESNRYESDRGRRSSYDRRSYERDYEKSDRDGERRVISVGKKSGGNAERRYDDETRLDEYQERRSIVVGKKQKMRSPQEAREPEYISHVISAQAIERKNECSSRRRSRSRSGSRSRHRSRSKSRSRRSKSKDRRRSRSRSSKRRYERDSPKRDYDYNRQSSRGGERRSSRDRERRSKDRDVYSGRRDEKSSREDQYQRSRSGSRERRESREHGFRSPGYQRKETEKRSSTRDDHNETDDKYYMHAIKTEEPRTFQEERRIVAGDSSKRRFVEEKEETKPLTSDLADIFADLPPPRAKKNPITMAFSTYVPRAVKLKQYQPPETSLNPESRPPPESVLPVYQQSRNKNVTEIKDQVFSMTKTLDIMKHDEKMIDFSARGITVAKPRQEYRRSRSKSPYERSYNSKSHKSRSRSPDNKRSITVHRVVDKRSSSRSPVRSSSKRRDTRSRSHSREKLSNKKRYGRSRSRSKSPERKRQYSGRKPSKRSESRSRSRSSSKGRSGRHVFPAAKTMKRSRSKSVGKYDKKKDSKRSYSRSRSPEGERRSISVKKSINKDDKSKDKVPDIKIPTIKSKWDSPEEKSSRWDETHKSNTKSLEMPLIISSAQEHAFACAAASMISSSPPPHRQMKPEEKKKMEEKWKALEVKDEIDNAIILEEMTDIQIKKSVEASAREIENQLKSGSDGKKNNDTTKESLKAGKKMKDHGMRSKWDSDSSSSSSRSRGRRRSSSSSSSSSRSRSREKDSKKSSSKRSTGSAGKVKSDSGKKEISSEQRVFWFHKKEVTGFSTGKKSKKSSQKSKRSESRSPKRKKSRSRSPSSSKKKLTKDDINKNPFKTKTKTSHTVTSSSVVMPKVVTPKPVKVEKAQNDSLQEMEKFLNKLKSDKKMKDQQRTFKK